MSSSISAAALEAVKSQFFEGGISVVDWARENGFDVHLVYGVLSGRSRASRGESHRIAVALGLKSGAAQLPRRVSQMDGVAQDAGAQPVRAQAEREAHMQS
ncbi:MAG: DNA-binding protein [Aquabacterium sp.]